MGCLYHILLNMNSSLYFIYILYIHISKTILLEILLVIHISICSYPDIFQKKQYFLIYFLKYIFRYVAISHFISNKFLIAYTSCYLQLYFAQEINIYKSYLTVQIQIYTYLNLLRLSLVFKECMHNPKSIMIIIIYIFDLYNYVNIISVVKKYFCVCVCLGVCVCMHILGLDGFLNRIIQLGGKIFQLLVQDQIRLDIYALCYVSVYNRLNDIYSII